MTNKKAFLVSRRRTAVKRLPPGFGWLKTPCLFIPGGSGSNRMRRMLFDNI